MQNVNIENELTEKLTTELAALEMRCQTLQAEADQAATMLHTARNAVVSGDGTTAKLIAAQSAHTALAEAVAELTRRIEAKRRAIAEATAQAQQDAQRQQLQAIAATGAASLQQIESTVNGIFATLETELGGLADLLEIHNDQLENFVRLDKALGAELQTDEASKMRETMQIGANLRALDKAPFAELFGGGVRGCLDNLQFQRTISRRQAQANAARKERP